MECPTLQALSYTTEIGFSCVMTNVLGNKLLHDAMATCCGPSKVYELDSGCTNSCNITSYQDAIFWDFCLSDTLDSDLYATIEHRCFLPSDILKQPPNISATGIIATTWTAPNREFTTTFEYHGMTTTLTETLNDYSDYVENSLLPSRAATNGSHTSTSTATASSTTGVSTTEVVPKSTATSSTPSATQSQSPATKGGPVSNFKIAALGGLTLFGLLV